MKSEDKKFDKALSYAYRLLSYRPRSKKELCFRLKHKSFDEDSVKRVIKHLEEIDYINDKEFARYWIRMRLSAKPCGVSLLCYELKNKGVCEGLIKSTINELTKHYDERKTAIKLAKERKSKFKKVDTNTAKRRIFGYLKRRGFSYSDIYDAIDEVFNK